MSTSVSKENDQVEQTLVMIKPDAIERGLVERIREEITSKGLEISLAGTASFTLELVRTFYQWDRVKCPETVQEYLCTSPIPLWIIRGKTAINRMMEIKMRLRRTLCSGDHRNLLHCSSSELRFQWEFCTLVDKGMIATTAR